MARLYTDEDFSTHVAQLLRELGHDVLTVQESGRAGQRIPDHEVLTYATQDARVVITHNRKDFIRLHKKMQHTGIVICTTDSNVEALAQRIDAVLKAEENSEPRQKLMRVVRPPQ